MDFYQIKEREGSRKGILEVYPDFKVMRSKDLMVKAKSFYAIWDEEKQLWSTDEFDVPRLVDKDILNYEVKTPGNFEVRRRVLGNFSSSSWLQFRKYVGHLTDNGKPLDDRITFANTEVKKEDYISKRLPYSLAPGDISAWDTLIGTLYAPEERAKIEWAIGAIISGDSKTIQKFLVFYGSAGTGKSTVLNIIQWLFEGYWTAFVAKELASANNSFALEAFKNNPLVAIEHDGDLSKIQDNSKLNSLVAHESMEINEKNKPKYMAKFNAMLMIGSNEAVKITGSKSGLIRRLIDIHPTGKLIPPRKYQTLMNQIQFELGAIAHHCLEVYRGMGKDYYSGYRPVEMMLQTDIFFNFIESHYDIFKEDNGVTLKRAYDLYKEYISSTGVERGMPQYKMREELKNYFDEYHDRYVKDGERLRSWYQGFNADRFKAPVDEKEHMFSLIMDETESIFDKEYKDAFAQYSNERGTPKLYWNDDIRVDSNGKEFKPKKSQIVSTTLSDLDTSKEHYVRVPENHIVIDFDLKDADGNKSLERSLEAASQWPSTYGEYSKSGEGIHLHYDYVGDVSMLSRIFEEGIEVKVFTGNTSLRRKLTKCNNVPIAVLTGGLPLKEKKVINEEGIKSEKALRDLIERNLRKEIHPGTKPSMDFIHKILEDAYKSDLSYDVSDMRNRIMAFANNSTNQSLYCIKLMQTMEFKSENNIADAKDLPAEERLVIYDVEVFPNLFVVCWKYKGDGNNIVKMINPKAEDIERLMAMKLVGFNCRRYDNHILYGAYMGYNNAQLYKLSQKLISNSPNGYFGEAYNISYADIYDFSSKKQSLKKFQIELGLTHKELGLPWDKDVPEELWETVADYCANDVETTDATFDARIEDFIAREILSDLSGLPVNATTQQHTAKIVFGDEKKPQEQFVYTDLSEMFPGYTFDSGKSTYKDEVASEGGYVYAEPGMYENVAVLDIASMHPTSIEQLDLFGPYTENFSALKQARLAIKRKDYDSAKKMLGGKLTRHLTNDEQAEALSYALKIVINIVYGLTAAKFDNAFRDPRNIDNIVAKRGALFMIELKHFVQSKGFTVAHIKTDSIKIPNATKEIIDLVMEFGDNYGYTFEHEATYEVFCLVNDAVYIARTLPGRKPAYWHAVGAQFQHPYVYKTLFSKEPLKFADKCETKSVTTAIYLDFNEPDDNETMALYEESDDKRVFVGKVGLFCPIKKEDGGGRLVRESDGKFHAITGTKGFYWLEADKVKTLKKEKLIDMTYFNQLVDKAIDTINNFGDFDEFVA